MWDGDEDGDGGWMGRGRTWQKNDERGVGVRDRGGRVSLGRELVENEDAGLDAQLLIA